MEPRTRQEDLKVLGNRVEMVEKRKKKQLVDGTSYNLALEYDIDVLWVGAKNNNEPLQCKN
jgi:hypothetical protein